MFPYTSETTGGNYYETAVPYAHDQSQSSTHLIYSSRPHFLNHDITTNYPINSNSASSAGNQDLQAVDPPPPFFYFPSPFEENDFLLHHQQPQHHQNVLSSFHENTLIVSPPPPPPPPPPHHHHQQTAGTPMSTATTVEDNDQAAAVISKEGEQQQQQQQQRKQIQIPTTTMNMMTRKSSCKKDRHSKITTARGVRDRRMRLSLDVARRFFGLQDVLGFDKASKTVEWLLNQAGAEIKKAAREMNQTSSTAGAGGTTGARTTTSSISECEVVSGTDEQVATTEDITDKIRSNKIASSPNCGNKNRIKRSVRKPKKTALFNPQAKASRERARARARERTREKMGSSTTSRQYSTKPCDDDEAKKKKNQMLIIKPELSRLSSWSSTFETGEESQSHHNMNSNYSPLEALAVAELEEQPIISSFHAAGTSSRVVVGVHRQDLIGIDGHDAAAAASANSLVTMGKCTWSPSSIFNSLQQNTSTTAGSISQEQQQQFADFHFFGKPWEVYSLF